MTFSLGSEHQRWAIRNRSSRALLGSGRNHGADEAPIATASFDGSVAMLFNDRRMARAVWLKWLTHKSFIRRRVTLAGSGVSYDVLMDPPDVDLVVVTMAVSAIVPFILQSNGDPDD